MLFTNKLDIPEYEIFDFIKNFVRPTPAKYKTGSANFMILLFNLAW